MQIKLLSLVMATFFLLFSGDIFAAVCGDSLPDPGEQCDDGNATPGDGCSASCQVEAGFACTAAIADPVTPSVCGYGPGQIQIIPASILVDENSGSVTLNVTRTGGSLGQVNVNFTTVDGTANSGIDYQGVGGVLTFVDNDFTNKSINVTIIDDSDPETIETFSVELSSPTGGASLGNGVATVNIIANDPNAPPSPPPVITSPPDGASVTIEGDASDPFVVTWSASIDPDDDPVNYFWQMFDGANFAFAADLGDQTTTQGLLTMGVMRQFLNTEFGMTRGDSRTFNHRAGATDNISGTFEDFWGPFASVTLTIGNFSPTADDDSYNATEDTLLTIAAPGVLDGDTDPEDDPLTAVLDTDVSNGTLDLSEDGSFTYNPDDNYCGDDSFTYKANDGSLDSNIAAVTINVVCVNDPPEVTSVDLAAQTVDYSDDIATVTVVVTDIDDASTTLAESGEPTEPVSSLSLTAATPNCVTDNTLSPNATEIGSVCTWTYDGQVLSPGDNVHDIVFTASDSGKTDSGAGTVTGTHELTIEPEDADVMLDGDNDVSAEVDSPGGDSGPFSLFFAAYETDNPDFSHGSSADFGDLNTMEPFMTLVPVGPGSPVDADSCALIAPLPVYPAEGYDQEAFFQCDFDDVPVNTYEVQARVDGLSDETIYYSGLDEDVFTVFDPSLGFTTGGGWFYWPDTADEELTECGPEGYAGDKTNFGFNLKYNKKKKTAKGSVLVMRHTVDENCLDAGSFRVKSNAIEGMSVGDGEDANGAYGWATAAGKSVFREPGLEGEGNHKFLMYVEDHGQQGCNQDPVDEFWIEVKDKDEVIVLQLNGPDPAGPDEATDAEDEPIVCGNITVPHKSGKGGGGGGGGPKEPNPNKRPKG